VIYTRHLQYCLRREIRNVEFVFIRGSVRAAVSNPDCVAPNGKRGVNNELERMLKEEVVA
jgi:hypothetical protein